MTKNPRVHVTVYENIQKTGIHVATNDKPQPTDDTIVSDLLPQRLHAMQAAIVEANLTIPKMTAAKYLFIVVPESLKISTA
ncbi:hypothetical protein V1478_000792 [Vespula squamosa]|uniref:Uncharacterized protein n=1 Tax=Vespula squamosa TaxID=30214 RepID=A0ABD2C6H9_VESSQ